MIKPKFHGSSFPQFPQSILVANVRNVSLTCYEEIWHVGRGCYTRMLATFRPSQHVTMVWHVAGMSAASCGCVGLVEFGE